jgi:aspartate aminotransferase
LSGTGAVRVAAELLSQTNPADAPKDVLVSAETWPAHRTIFEGQGFKVIPHRYFDAATRAINFEGMKADLRAAAERSVLILHLCGHNPTGCDPSQEQWRELCEIAQEKRFRVIFDSAYQGYASGSLERDAYAARYFATQGVQFMTCQSYAKNMGMYGDRLGCFSLTCSSPAVAKNVTSYLKARVLRPLWSNPPRRPSRVAHRIQTDPALFARWQAELASMAGRIQHIRKVVHDELVARATPGSWRHIVDQIGMFSYTGLTEAQCVRLQKDFHIYMLPTGRASLAGLQDHTAVRFARALDCVVRDLPTPEDVVNMV